MPSSAEAYPLHDAYLLILSGRISFDCLARRSLSRKAIHDDHRRTHGPLASGCGGLKCFSGDRRNTDRRYLNWVVEEIERTAGEIDYSLLMPWHCPVGQLDD